MRKIVPSVAKELNINFPEIDLGDLRSDEEFFYLCWLSELCNAGYVDNVWYEYTTFELYGGYEKLYEERLKTKVNHKCERLIKPTVYTPDFKVEWTQKAEGVFYYDYVDKARLTSNNKPLYHLGSRLVSHVEIKPVHNQNNMTSYAQLKINWLFATQGVYINMFKIPTMFGLNFYPGEYLVTDVKRSPRNVGFPVIGDYLK